MNISSYTDSYGVKYWYNDKGQFHREDGPSIEYSNGKNCWHINGKLYREDGPAIEYGYKVHYKAWYYNGEFIGRSENGFTQ